MTHDAFMSAAAIFLLVLIVGLYGEDSPDTKPNEEQRKRVTVLITTMINSLYAGQADSTISPEVHHVSCRRGTAVTP